MPPITDWITYIMYSKDLDKYYCGKTKNIEQRMKEHKNDLRSSYSLIWQINGDYEKMIKRISQKNLIFFMTKGALVVAPPVQALVV